MAAMKRTSPTNAPVLGGARRERDPRLWNALLSGDRSQQLRVVRTLQALELDEWYGRQLLDSISLLPAPQRASAGEAVSLLGDPRFSPPYFLSEMMVVPGGTALLGSREYRDEQPLHEVEVEGFALAQFPVTQMAYAAFVQATKHRSPLGWRRGQPDPVSRNCPVVGVSARDAEAYCDWLSRQTGFHFRLPTEAEWVMAARGTNQDRTYPWGNQYEEGRANALGGLSAGRLCAVGLFPAGQGPYGHADLAGNVWEWCSSLYWPYPYRADDGRENPASNQPRVMHGGSWRSRPFSVRCAARQGEPPTDRFEVVGFRLARDGHPE